MIYKPEWGIFSAVALILWVPFGLWLFTRQRPTRAAAHVLIWGMMWLPEAAGFDFPLLPPLDKYSISALVALMGLWWKAPYRLKSAKLGRGYDWVVLVMILAIAGTVYNNGDALRYGNYKIVDLPAFTAYDGFSAAIRLVFNIAVPCWLGRALLRSRRDLVDVFRILTVSGVVYSIPIFWELRMSPMLHSDIYGFVSRTDWLQNMRQGGFRATVFMGHGLVVGFFMFLCTVSAITLRKAGLRRMLGLPMWVIVSYLFVTLVLCKASAALIYGLVAYALISWLGVKNQMRVMLLVAAIVAAYPVSRMFEWFPVKEVMSAAEMLGPERAQSMQFRFDNEDILLIKGSEKMWFGWGGFARDRVYDENYGKDLVVQDGYWIAVFGQQGLVGFLCFFTLMLWPVVTLARSMRKLKGSSDRVLLGGLGIMVVICAVNLLPNMALPNLQLFFAAGLAVLTKTLPIQVRVERAQEIAPKKKIEKPRIHDRTKLKAFLESVDHSRVPSLRG
jgi:hypothetical protein